VGRFIHANVSTAEIDDRTLAHLQVVILRLVKLEETASSVLGLTIVPEPSAG